MHGHSLETKSWVVLGLFMKGNEIDTTKPMSSYASEYDMCKGGFGAAVISEVCTKEDNKIEVVNKSPSGNTGNSLLQFLILIGILVEVTSVLIYARGGGRSCFIFQTDPIFRQVC